MRIHSLALSATLVLSAAPAAAQSGASDYPATGQSAVSSVQVTAPPRGGRVLDADPDAVSGQYRLSNGWRLQVEPGYSGIWTRIDRQRPMRLSAVSDDTYVSHDGKVLMRFDLKNDEMLMRYVPQSRLAEVIEVRATLARR
ncbi:hypothetical protein LQ564_23255 [Massilia sp. G4R7]|uniref:Uncharacterized protein n=1 Tax=Massilia phyllostachyos TaxID=2898585 RepID=A0ABS8QBT0_9BURK|nr:hypothetical protein [Massilia phyllostachyos]MCD2519223.1 hypothetical protein [Massilia phyllostachyos]